MSFIFRGAVLSHVLGWCILSAYIDLVYGVSLRRSLFKIDQS